MITENLSARAVIIKNVVQGASAYEPALDAFGEPLSKMLIKLNGLKTPFTSDETDSFQMTTFNIVDDQFYYYIDQVINGLTINSKCDYPCKDCLDSDPSHCLSCYKDEGIKNGRPFLQVDTCVERCSSTRYYDAGLDSCQLCNPTCLTCETTKDTCTSCGIDEYLFLHEAECLTICPDRFIEDPSANRCIACQDNCLTCEELPTSCTSCDPLSEFKYFFHESCIASCIPKISVLVGDQCVECDSKCKECAGTPSTCTACEPHMKFDESKSTCEDLCEPETQIFIPNEDPSLAGHCAFCAGNCYKCAGSVTTCTECRGGFLLTTEQTCEEKCSAENQTPIDGICMECESPCATCQGSVQTCTTCIDDYFLFHDSKCVQYCPEKYKDKDGVCVFEGLVCPAGFELNQAKDGCIPLNYDCAEGYIINDQKTACVPKPGSALPFPFLLTSVLFGFLVFGSYLKEKHQTKVVSNLIALIGCLEVLMYGMMCAYALALDEGVIFAFVLIGLIGLFASNIFFVVYYRSKVCANDQQFVKWLHFFPTTRFWMPLLCLLVNFKAARMLYSGFYGLENTMARFG